MRTSALPVPLVLIAVLLVACSAEPRAPADQPANPTRTATSLAEVAGSWDIVSFDEHRPTRLGSEGLRRAYVDISANDLSYTIECNYSGNPARIDKAGVLHDTGDGSRMQTLMGCGPKLEARDKAFFGFFATGPKVQLLEGGQLRMWNGRTELILERPEVRRLANIPPIEEITGRWVPRVAMRIFPRGGHEGWGFEEPGVLSITGDRLTYSRCGRATFAFRYARDARLVTTGAEGQPECGDVASEILLRVLRSGPLVERTGGGGIALSAGDEVISLQSEKELQRLRENPPPAPPIGVTPPPPPPPPPPNSNRGQAD